MFNFSYRKTSMRKSLVKAIDSLDGFINNIHYGRDLTCEESRRNLENGLVKVCVRHKLSCLERTGFSNGDVNYSVGGYCSNGLLITSDGYFLTAKHCLEGDLSYASITNSSGATYPIEKLCAVSTGSSIEGDDLALAKAQIPVDKEYLLYRIYNSKILGNSPVILMTRKGDGGKLKCYYGLTSGDVARFAHLSKNYFSILTDGGNPGDSGGIVVSPIGELMGIISKGYSLCKLSTGTPKKTMYVGMLATEITNALKLVDIYRMALLKRLHR